MGVSLLDGERNGELCFCDMIHSHGPSNPKLFLWKRRFYSSLSIPGQSTLEGAINVIAEVCMTRMTKDLSLDLFFASQDTEGKPEAWRLRDAR